MIKLSTNEGVLSAGVKLERESTTTVDQSSAQDHIDCE